MLDLVVVLLKGKNDVSTSERALPNDRKFVCAVSSTNCALLPNARVFLGNLSPLAYKLSKKTVWVNGSD